MTEAGPKKKRRHYSTISPGTAFMVEYGSRRLIVRTWWDEPENDSDEPAHEVVTIGFDQGQQISLTALTEPELLAFMEGVRLAVNHAMPTVRMLDKEAHDGNEAGQLPRKRLYKRMPVVAIKRRLFGGDAEGIQERFERVVYLDNQTATSPSIDPTGLAASGVTRRAVPERLANQPGASNGVPEADEHEGVGEEPGSDDLYGQLPGSEDCPEGTTPDS